MYLVPANDPYVAAIVAETNNLDPSLARANVYAARLAAAKYGFKVEALLAQAWVESRFQRYDLSRVQCKNGVCGRRTGRWAHKYKPPGAKPSYYCGPMQVGGYVSWKECRRLMQDLVANYSLGAAHVREWEKYAYKDKRCRKYAIGTRYRLTCAYRGYVGGWKGLYSSRNSYSRRIYWKQARIKRRVNKLVAARTEAWQKKISKELMKHGPNSDSKSALSVGLSWSEQSHFPRKQKEGFISLPRWPLASTVRFRMFHLSAQPYYVPEKTRY